MAKYFTQDGDEYKEVDENLFTQTEIDTNIIPKRLERERSKFADYDDLKEKAGKVDTIEDEWKGKLETVTTEKTDLEKKLEKANLNTEKVKITHEFKLSDELSEFVTGDTVDEMRKRAEKLSKGIKTKVFVNKDGKPDDDKKSDSKKLAGKLFNRDKSDD